jgi:thiosulfate reductase cytochrome b subunit
MVAGGERKLAPCPWFFVINGAVYLGYGILSGHFRRDLAPKREQLSARHLWHEIVEHGRLRFPEGEEARHYNALQKLTYLVVIAGLLPTMVLTGLTMAPGADPPRKQFRRLAIED